MNENFELETVNAEIVAPTVNVLDIQERASIDMQISTAKRYPRSISKFTQTAVSYATLDEETAASCIYRRPVGKGADGQQTFAEGMSIRTAEIVGSCFGNLRVGARIVEQTDRFVKAQGVAHDLESNFLATSEVIESTINKYGKPYDERMRVVVAKAALAKARRDATFMVVPKALAKPIEKAVRDLLFGDAKSLAKRREAAEQWIKKLGIVEDRVYRALGISGIQDMTIEHLEILAGLRTSIKDKETSIDEAFPEIKDEKPAAITEKPGPAASGVKSLKEKLSGKKPEVEPQKPGVSVSETIRAAIERLNAPVTLAQVEDHLKGKGLLGDYGIDELEKYPENWQDYVLNNTDHLVNESAKSATM